jgi:hypothetical protein
MHTVARLARIKDENRIEERAVDEAMRKGALLTTEIKKVQSSYTFPVLDIREIDRHVQPLRSSKSGLTGCKSRGATRRDLVFWRQI